MNKNFKTYGPKEFFLLYCHKAVLLYLVTRSTCHSVNILLGFHQFWRKHSLHKMQLSHVVIPKGSTFLTHSEQPVNNHLMDLNRLKGKCGQKQAGWTFTFGNVSLTTAFYPFPAQGQGLHFQLRLQDN